MVMQPVAESKFCDILQHTATGRFHWLQSVAVCVVDLKSRQEAPFVTQFELLRREVMKNVEHAKEEVC